MTHRPAPSDEPIAFATPASAPDAGWRVSLFGPVRAVHPALGAAVFRTQRAKSLLALLVDAGGAPLGRLHIAAALWPESANGPANLACELFHLRKQLDAAKAPFFTAASGALAVAAGRCQADVDAFEAALAAAESATGDDDRLAALERAAALYAGPFAADVYDDWTEPRRRALADAALGALDRLAELRLAAGDPDRAIGHARRALGLDPLDRRAALALLAALAASGRHASARDAADAIAADHAAAGVAPEAALRDAIAAARAGEGAGRTTTGIAAPSDDASAAMPVLPPPIAPQASAPPLPSGTLTFVIADEAPDERRVARSPVRGEPWLPKSERERVLAAPADPAEAARERDAGRALARRLFEGRVREAAGRCVTPRIAVFASALDAVEAAAATLEALAAQDPLRRDRATMPQLRLALVTAEATPAAGAAGFPYDPAIAGRLERLVAAAAGWQVLCEDATALLVAAEQQLNIGRRVERLGLVRLDPAAAPQAVHGLRYGGSEGFRYPPPAGLVPAAGAAALASSTSFVGRGDDLARIGAWIADPTRRLITLKGLGGIGKTRLAMALAAAHRDRLAVWSASLVDLRDGALIAAEVVKAMGESVPAGMSADEVIVAALSRRPSLLVLDNLEHLLEPAVAFIDRLLSSDALPDLTVLATSRDRLKHSAEHVYDVAPLPVPDARPRPMPVLPPRPSPDTVAVTADPVRGNDSVRLFADRAAAKRAAFGEAFAADDAAAADVARLVTLLEGIPLAIELAAAKIAALSPAQMADQIERHLGGGRYGLLKGADRDIPERHKSLQAAMDWSWALLTPAQQRFLASLSVFRGGMTLEAAAYVTEDPEALDHLLALVDASLLQRIDVAGEREPRFGMLETVREYGEGLVRTGVDVLVARHGDYFARLAEEAAPELEGGAAQEPWLSYLDADWPNLDAMLSAVTGESVRVPITRQAVHALHMYWVMRSRSLEAVHHLRPMLGVASAAGGVDPAYLAFVVGTHAWRIGDREHAAAYLQRALDEAEHMGDRHLVSKVHHNLGCLWQERGAYAAAQRELELSLAAKADHSATASRARTLNALANIQIMMGDRRAAEVLLAEAEEVAEEIGLLQSLAVSATLGAQILLDAGRFDDAERASQRAASLAEQANNAYLVAHAELMRGAVRQLQGELEAAQHHLAQAAALADEISSRYLADLVAYQQAELAVDLGELVVADKALQCLVERTSQSGDDVLLGLALSQRALVALAHDDVPAAARHLIHRLGLAPCEVLARDALDALELAIHVLALSRPPRRVDANVLRVNVLQLRCAMDIPGVQAARLTRILAGRALKSVDVGSMPDGEAVAPERLGIGSLREAMDVSVAMLQTVADT